MITVIALVAFLAGMQAPPVTNSTPQTALDVANATKFQLTYDGDRVNSCTITATSWNPQVDRYVCEAARFCGDHYKAADARASCLTAKREELAGMIAKGQAPAKPKKQ